MTEAEDLSGRTVRELLATHEAVLATLRTRGVVRTSDAPASQYAEWLALQMYGGTLEPDSKKSHDLTTADGTRLQVKCRVLRNGTADERQLSPFRSVDFDEVLIIFFDATYEVQHAAVLTAEQVLRLARWQPHENGRVLIARDAVLNLGTDVKKRVRKVRSEPVSELQHQR